MRGAYRRPETGAAAGRAPLWVLTLPYPLRYRCAYDAGLTSEVLRAFLRALFSTLRRRAKSQWGAPRGQCGSVTFIQRFGSALNLNVHFHTLALDGVYGRDGGHAPRLLLDDLAGEGHGRLPREHRAHRLHQLALLVRDLEILGAGRLALQNA
jgi:hypothetical protein